MLETFRKYTGLMFVVLILLFVGLVFFGSSGQGVFSGPKVIHAYGRGYTAQELNRFAEKPARMLKELSGELYSTRYRAVEPFLSRMGVITYNRFRLTEDQVASFLVNRVALHRAMKEFGVYTSTAEVEQFLKEDVFWENEAFNDAAYAEFTQKSLPKLGMSVKQMNDVIGEIIALRKLEDVVGAGATASREAVMAQHLNNTQRITYQLAAFPLAEFEDKQEPGEEELKAHWEENKGSYLSEPKRRITYILARPDYVALEKELYPDPTGDGEAAPEGGEGAEPPKPSGDSKLTEEQRNQAVLDLGLSLDSMLDQLDSANGEGFEDLARELGFEVKTTDLVERDALPPEITGQLRNTPGKTGADLIFDHVLGDEPMYAFSEVKKIGTDQWFFFRLDEVVEPSELTFEEARDQVRQDVVRDAALAAMEEEAKAKRTAVAEGLAAGKSFEELAKELELNVTPFEDTTRPPTPSAPEVTAFNLSARTNPGELSEVEVETSDEPDGVNRAIFSYVEKRVVYEDKNLESTVDRQVEEARDRNRTLALANWFAQEAAKAEVRFAGRE